LPFLTGTSVREVESEIGPPVRVLVSLAAPCLASGPSRVRSTSEIMFTDHSKSRTLSVKQTVPFDGNLDRLDLTVAALGAVTVRRRR
jgi:hypothetical protein